MPPGARRGQRSEGFALCRGLDSLLLQVNVMMAISLAILQLYTQSLTWTDTI